MTVLDVVAWVHVVDNRLLTVRSRGRDLLYLPGGKREPGEDDWTALSREVHEELSLTLDPTTFRELGVVHTVPHDQPARYTKVRMACFTATYKGEIKPAAEIDEYLYLSPTNRARLAPASQAALALAQSKNLL